MKKVLATLAIGGLFIATSCKADYHCECTSGGITGEYGEISNVTKKDADEYCASQQSLLQIGDPSATCEAHKGDH